ncbi:glycosyl transferase [Salinarimonas soli]|uniref:Glycosyl transferase n=1 Tax=Salinarimonas soli TaxID=1638099 RepID=A0A5B2VFH1_9HYPH|nr:glycosyl transferase [Salinarimonas soli]KAA2237871.1 glycosyl transferase [Salinarimonas soli]
MSPLVPAAAALAAALACAGLVVALRPLLARYALARPNARSSHVTPTPQGGGIAVIAAALGAGAGALALTGIAPGFQASFAWLAAAATALGLVGAVDDIRPLPALPRLLLQVACVALVVFVVGGSSRILPDMVPLWLERALSVLAGVWFVNLVNFMDGLDWITVAEMVPVCAAVLALALALDRPGAALVAAALGGALLGFAPFNKPVARLFLGDVGSLPIGLLVAWMLYELAAAGALAAALLLPLYYLADATITLARRLLRGERIWEAHRSHFYQRATANGFSVRAVVGHVFGLNLALAGLAAVTLGWPGVQAPALALGAALVGLVLRRFSHPSRETDPWPAR